MPSRRWGIALLLGFGVLVNYFDRVNLSVSQQALTDAFGISAVTFGYLSSFYNWPYAALQLPCGLLLDRFGVRRVGRISTVIWSLASFGAAAATRIHALFAARFLLGIGEAPTFPANAKAVGYWFPQQERSLATAMFDSAAKFAPGVGVPIIGIFSLHFGWRWSFAATGLVSLAYFALFYVFYRNPSEDAALTAAERNFIAKGGAQPEDQVRSAKGAPLLYLLKQPKVLGLALGFASYNYTFYLLLAWLPSYLSTALHIDLFHSVLYSSVPWLFAGVIDLSIGGLLVDGLIQRGWNPVRVRQVVLIGGTSLGLGIFGAYTVLDFTRGGWDAVLANTFITHVNDIDDGEHINYYPSWDVSLSYRFSQSDPSFLGMMKGLTLKVGVNDLFDRQPSTDYDTFIQDNSDISTYSPIARFVYVEGRYKF